MKFTPKKNKIENKRDLSRPLPSHVPTRESLEKALLEQPELLPTVSVDYFMKRNSLPQNVNRNVIACNFNDYDELVILFDTGEKIKTKPINVKEMVEQYITVQQTVEGSAPSGDSIQEVFIGEPTTLPSYPALIFQPTTIDGQQVYTMRVNVP